MTISSRGVEPPRLQVDAGDRVAFQVAAGETFRYRPRSTGGGWQFAYPRATPLGPDDPPFVVPQAITSPGTYSFAVFEDAAPYTGEVTLAAGSAPATPSPGPVPPLTASPLPGPAATVPAPRGGAPSPALAARLPQPRTGRDGGLAVVLAVTALLGVGSMLVRVLLAEPLPKR